MDTGRPIRTSGELAAVGHRSVGPKHLSCPALPVSSFFLQRLFLASAVYVFAASFVAARFVAHIFLVAAMIAARPAALSLRFGFGAGAVFFVTAAPFAFAALAALAFFRFAARIALAAAESFRFALGAVAGAGGSASPLILAHLAFCAKAIFRRAAALNFLRFPGAASGVVAISTEPPDNMARSSLICWSISIFCCSNPAIAAEIICEVNL
jgi:hypothetical protein